MTSMSSSNNSAKMQVGQGKRVREMGSKYGKMLTNVKCQVG